MESAPLSCSFNGQKEANDASVKMPPETVCCVHTAAEIKRFQERIHNPNIKRHRQLHKFCGAAKNMEVKSLFSRNSGRKKSYYGGFGEN